MAPFRRTATFLLFFSLLYLNCTNKKIFHPSPKIGFDLNAIDTEGLIGPPDGKVALSYEFCIPADDHYLLQVRQVDPSLKLHKTAKGRIACSKAEWLCVGNTHQEDARMKLNRLAAFAFIKRIERVYFE